MLKLDRKVGEKIFIGDDISIQITEFRHNGEEITAKVGIEAPPAVPIARHNAKYKRPKARINWRELLKRYLVSVAFRPCKAIDDLSDLTRMEAINLGTVLNEIEADVQREKIERETRCRKLLDTSQA